MKIVMIVGASSGIGKEFTLQLDRCFSTNIDEFWLISRNKKGLLEVADKLRHNTKVVAMDITQERSLTLLENKLKKADAKICVLVNCAGYGLMGNFAKQDRKETLGMIRLNCEALTSVTHRMIPYMRRNSRIIQMASSAAFLPQENFAVYAATKSYVLSFSRALRQELESKGISVTAVCPGPVDTPFFEIAEKNGSTLQMKKYTMLPPEFVVEKAIKDAKNKKAISVCGLPMNGFWLLSKVLPHGTLLQITKYLKELEK